MFQYISTCHRIGYKSLSPLILFCVHIWNCFATIRIPTFRLTTFRLQVYLYPLRLINRGRFLYSFAKTCYIFSGIQLLITDKIIFINPASIEWKPIFIHASRLISSFYLREKLFRSIQLLFQHRNVFINPTSISGNSFFINPASILK